MGDKLGGKLKDRLGDKGVQGLGKADTPSDEGNQKGRQAGRQGTQGRQGLRKKTHHPTKGNKKRDSVSWEAK